MVYEISTPVMRQNAGLSSIVRDPTINYRDFHETRDCSVITFVGMGHKVFCFVSSRGQALEAALSNDGI